MSCLSLAIYHYRRPEISAGARASFNKIAAARQEDQNDVDGEIWPGERVATTTTTRDGCRKQHEEKKNTDSNHYSNNHSSQQDSLSSQKTAKLNLVCPIASRTTVAAGGGGCGLPRPGDHSDWAVAVQLSAKKKKKHHNEISQTKTTTTTLSSTNAPKQQQHRLKLFHVIIQLVCLQLFLTRTFKESLAGPVPSGFLDSGHAIACTIGQQVEIRDYIPISDPNLERCVICSCPNGSVDCRRSTDPDCSAKTPPSHAFGNPQKHPSNRLPNGGGGNRVYPTTSGHHHGGATHSHYHHQHTHNHPHHSYSKPPVIGKAKTVAVARKPAKAVATGSGQQQSQQQQQPRSLKQQTTWTGHGLARATTGHNNRQQYGPTMGDLGSPEPSQPDELAETTAQEEVEVRRVVQSPRTTFRYSSAASAPASSDSALVQPDGPDILRPPRLPLNDPQHRAAAAEALGWSHEKYNSKISQLLSKRASTSTARQQPTTIEITTTTTAATTTTQPPPPAVLVDVTSIEPGDGRGELEPDNTDQTADDEQELTTSPSESETQTETDSSDGDQFITTTTPQPPLQTGSGITSSDDWPPTQTTTESSGAVWPPANSIDREQQIDLIEKDPAIVTHENPRILIRPGLVDIASGSPPLLHQNPEDLHNNRLDQTEANQTMGNVMQDGMLYIAIGVEAFILLTIIAMMIVFYFLRHKTPDELLDQHHQALQMPSRSPSLEKA